MDLSRIRNRTTRRRSARQSSRGRRRTRGCSQKRKPRRRVRKLRRRLVRRRLRPRQHQSPLAPERLLPAEVLAPALPTSRRQRNQRRSLPLVSTTLWTSWRLSRPRWTRQALVSGLLVSSNIQRCVLELDRAAIMFSIIHLQQRRFKAAFEAYKERELSNVKIEVCVQSVPEDIANRLRAFQRPGLRLQQYHELLFKQFQKSPDNPYELFNYCSVHTH